MNTLLFVDQGVTKINTGSGYKYSLSVARTDPLPTSALVLVVHVRLGYEAEGVRVSIQWNGNS